MSELSFDEQLANTEMNATALITSRQQSDYSRLTEILEELQEVVPPLWPLRDYVAVNPFLGLSGKTFLDARRLLCGVRDCDLLMPRDYFQSLLENGEITEDDISRALEQCQREYPDHYADLKTGDMIDRIANASGNSESERDIQTIAEVVDQHRGSTWQSHIVNDISRCVAAHYDEGQAVWQ
ncbi:MAG: DUF2309 family protein, partial [Planctomycetaceae bacterium]|nr:DUF2309 family protein [Planctomycetaceae bacterium]